MALSFNAGPSFSPNLELEIARSHKCLDLAPRNLIAGGRAVVQEMLDKAEELKLTVRSTDSGAKLISTFEATMEAALLGVRANLGNAASVKLEEREVAIGSELIKVPYIVIEAESPVVPCIAAQYAGLQLPLTTEKAFVMGSGPARLLAQKPDPFLAELGYQDGIDDTGTVALLAEVVRPLSDVQVREISEKLGIASDRLVVIEFSTNSLFGRVNIAGRCLETGLHALHSNGDPLSGIVRGAGAAPVVPRIVPPEGDYSRSKLAAAAIGRTNDGIRHGGEVSLTAADQKTFDRLKSIAERTPAYTRPKSFVVTAAEILERAGWDFSKVERDFTVRSIEGLVPANPDAESPFHRIDGVFLRAPLSEQAQIANAMLALTLNDYCSKS